MKKLISTIDFLGIINTVSPITKEFVLPDILNTKLIARASYMCELARILDLLSRVSMLPDVPPSSHQLIRSYLEGV